MSPDVSAHCSACPLSRDMIKVILAFCSIEMRLHFLCLRALKEESVAFLRHTRKGRWFGRGTGYHCWWRIGGGGYGSDKGVGGVVVVRKTCRRESTSSWNGSGLLMLSNPWVLVRSSVMEVESKRELRFQQVSLLGNGKLMQGSIQFRYAVQLTDDVCDESYLEFYRNSWMWWMKHTPHTEE